MTVLRSKLAEAAKKVWYAFKAIGDKVGDTTISSDLETAILELRLIEKTHELQTTDERRLLVAIVNAGEGFGDVGYSSKRLAELKKCIESARKVLEQSDMVVVNSTAVPL